MKTPRVLCVVRCHILALACPALLQAHPGHGAGSDGAAGLLHSLTSLDHLLVIAGLLGLGLAVGWWARRLPLVARWLGGGGRTLLVLGRRLTRVT